MKLEDVYFMLEAWGKAKIKKKKKIRWANLKLNIGI